MACDTGYKAGFMLAVYNKVKMPRQSLKDMDKVDTTLHRGDRVTLDTN